MANAIICASVRLGAEALLFLHGKGDEYMSNVIAKIMIAPGNVGWFDPLTRIHLTLKHKTSDVYDYQNTTNIKKAVAYGTVKLVYGTLDPVVEQLVEPEVVKAKPEKKQKPEVVEVKQEEVVVAQEEIVEQIAEEIIEEVVIEQKEEIIIAEEQGEHVEFSHEEKRSKKRNKK